MDNGQQYHMSQSFRPKMDLPPQVPSHLPPPPPPGVNHQRHIPFDSSQCHGPLPRPPPPPHIPNTFQDMRTAGSSWSHFSDMPSNSFNSSRYPPRGYSLPPPSVCSYEGERKETCQGVQQAATVVTSHQGYGLYQSITTDGYGCPAAPLVSGDSWSSMDSSPSHHTSRINVTHEDTVDFKKQNDQMWLRKFEEEILGRKHEQNCVTTKKKPIELIEVQEMICRSRTLTDKLAHLKEKVSLVQSNEEECCWEILAQIEVVKVELDCITQKFQDPVFLEDVRQLINQRRKKRLRSRKQHKLKIKEKKFQKDLWKKEEEKIDAWRERIQQEEEDKRREKAVKAEADTILGEVRQKQIDAVKMQQLLENLISLRIARLNKGAAHGFIATPQQDQIFSVTLKNITDVVNAQMDEYKLEEQTLRVMMEESTSYRRTNAGKEPKETISKLESSVKKILFGHVEPVDKEIYDDFTAAEHSLETLIQRRNEWDQFICNEDLPLASSVPSCWVIPPSHPSPTWETFQVKDQ